MPTKRRVGAAAVNRVGVNAGTMDSSSGRASVTPAPRKNVRLGMCRLLRNMMSSVGPPRRLVCLHSHLELRALHDAQYYRRKPVVVFRDVSRDRAHGRHIRVLEAAAERIR